MNVFRKMMEKGPRDTAVAGLRRAVSALERKPTISAASAATHPPLDSAFSEYLGWIEYAVAGMMARGNIDAMSFALRNLPNHAPMLEIGSFCGRSTVVLAHLKEKHGIPNHLFTCDRWNFEGQQLGSPLGDSKSVTQDDYRSYVRDSFLRNARTFCRAELPYSIEASSDAFFAQWSAAERARDVFGREVKLGGRLSFCYIDGNHSYDFAKRDFENTHRFLAPGGFVLFDDSGDGSGWEVCRVVKEVLNSGDYTLISKNPNYLFQKKDVRR